MSDSSVAPSRLAVVTGASSGIGESFVIQLAARGYDLLLTARREDKLQALAGQIRIKHPNVKIEIVATDLASDEGRDLVAARIRAAQNFALLVNNAGFGSVGHFHKASLQIQDEMHRLHVLTMLALSHAALGNLLARPNPQGTGIINVSSVASFGQSPSNVSYCATKAWATNFTEGLAVELASQKSPVKVQALCPGFTYSEFHDHIGMDRNPIPKQLWMTADFVATESLRAFDRGKLIVIPGWRYKLITGFMRTMPHWLMRRIATRAARKYRREKT
jgi:short-subunit dehydrogenase